VYYFWGLQQEEQGVVLPNGKLLPPRWYIRDMMWQVGWRVVVVE
jgi:import inner membrane translocase subunit TIM44